ncbi:Sulfite oxidase [Tolypocladium ophioglossoides CBS 100239]|uniref:Nitrate reductase [NADPH] n=1 Tax=Tolypocladium ophioglossoides (strain CBS 100239) TaxID=1163406 RepID=A0A0L0NIP7_TOLOC|nr:Sulfite oxidase [Tolypocladium ophioglossoides CBS 100239]
MPTPRPARLAQLLHLFTRPRLARIARPSAAAPTQQQCWAFRHSAPTRSSTNSSTNSYCASGHRPPNDSFSSARLSGRRSPRRAALLAGAGLVSFTLLSLSATPATTSLDATAAVSASGPNPDLVLTAAETSTAADNRDPSLPRFRIADVRKHGPESENPWVIHGDKVYDITDWIPAHPGGQVILRAAGGSIDPYWDIFAIHKNQYVYDILSQYLIGYIHPADLVNGRPAQEQIEDPFADDPDRHPALITKTAKPRNAETPADALGAQFLTPNELFYVRNHMWVPVVDEATSDAHLLTVELFDGTVKQYTLEDLKTRFPSHKVTAVLQCSGNRRKHMSEGSGRSTNGLQWAAGAISNASWEGVLLADVLADAGFEMAEALSGESETRHVHFSGMEAYGASIPIKKAVDPQGDVLLAYSMNDKPLPRDHGYPLRAIVPGHVAARSVKWLNQITLSDEESMSQWQRKDYKCFGPNETKVDWDAAPAIQELPVQSAITDVKLGGWTNAGGKNGEGEGEAKGNDQGTSKPPEGPAQRVSLGGYAFSGGGRSIIRVDASLDGGASWTQAYLLPDCASKDGSPSPCQGHGAWTWKRWRLDGAVPLAAFRDPEQGKADQAGGDKTADKDGGRRCATVMIKATDDAYNTQPESHAATWNFRGNLATAWHRIQVCADCSPAAVAAAADKGDEKP